MPGADADVVLLDPLESWKMSADTLHMATDLSVFDEHETIGKIKRVYSRGDLIIDGDVCLAQPGRGRYLHRKLPEVLEY